MRHLRTRKGFTLVEIMIVVAIIALLAAIAIPNLLRARHNANEAASISAMRSLSTALESYRAAQTPPSYPTAMSALSDSTPPYIDSALGGATSTGTAKQGYYYTYSRVSANEYDVTSRPASSGTTGTRVFFVDESGVIRLNSATGDPIE